MLGSMSEKLYYTYIVASRSHNFYVGMTSEIELRVQQHKEGRFEDTRRSSTAIGWSGFSDMFMLRTRSLVRSS